MPELDPALIGVIGAFIGSFTTIAGTAITQLFSMKKEERHWEKQQDIENTRRREEEEKQAKEKLRNIYRDSISSLSLMVSASSNQLEFSKDELRLIHKESLDVVTLLSILRAETNEANKRSLNAVIFDFIKSPVFYAEDLLVRVQELAINDKVLFPNGVEILSNPDSKSFHFLIDSNFRKQQIIDGYPVNTFSLAEYDLYKLRPTQREKLLDQHPAKIPNQVSLFVPALNSTKDKVVLRGNAWYAKINPNNTTFEEIFDEWEKDYEKALEQANHEILETNEG